MSDKMKLIMEVFRKQMLQEMPVWPQGSPNAGCEVHPSTMKQYKKYMEKNPRAKPPLEKGCRTEPKGGKGVPYRRKGGEDDDPTRYIDEEALNEEGADCIKDYMAMGYSYVEALKECGDYDDDSSEMSEVIDQAIDEELRNLEEGLLSKSIAALGLMLGLSASPDAQANTGAATSGGEPTTQQVQAEYNTYDVLLGMADTYIAGKSMDKKQDLLMDWAKVMSALDKASSGDESAINNLSSQDAKILKVLEQHVEKNAGDKELIDHWGKHGAGVQISTHGNLEEDAD
jgi:hypothetical protein